MVALNPESKQMRFRELAQLHTKQNRVLDAMTSKPNPAILAGGSGFGGKSRGLRAAAVYWHLWLYKHGFRGLPSIFASSSYEALRDRHFSHFGAEWGDLGQVVLNDKIFGRCFKFHNKKLGAICFRNLADPNERKGSEYAAGFLDELTEITHAVFGAFCYMVRLPGPPFHPIVAGSNPDGIGHTFAKALWRPQLYDQATGELLDPDAKAKPLPTSVDPMGGLDPLDYIYVPFLPDDNPAFSEEAFWRMVSHLPEHIQRARRYGTWDAPEGARFPYLDAGVHTFQFAEQFPQGLPQGWVRILGIDYGLRAPYAAIWSTIDYDGNVYTYREDYQAGLTADAQAERVLEKTLPTEKIDAVYLDPAMWGRFPGHQGPVEV